MTRTPAASNYSLGEKIRQEVNGAGFMEKP
jgi:hypothetical protein